MHKFWKTARVWSKGTSLKSPVQNNMARNNFCRVAQSARIDEDSVILPPSSISSNPENAQFDWHSLYTPENKEVAIKSFHPYTSKVKTAKQKTAKKSRRQRKTAKGNNIETSF